MGSAPWIAQLYRTSSSFSNIHTMIRTAHALLVAALLLCGPQEAALSGRGHCAGNECFALFEQPEDHPGAERSCRDSGGRLYALSRVHEATILGWPSGTYWLEQCGAGGSAAPWNCSAVSVSTGRSVTASQEPCRETLDGFLCQYPEFEKPCGRLRAGGGAQVNYTAHGGFEVNDSETFPPGTIAVAEKLGGEYPDSKHLCAESKWIPAPWSCEVLLGGCEHSCNRTTQSCTCPAARLLQPNGFTCAPDPCTGDGFLMEDGECVDMSICERCEHLLCDKPNGFYECQCRKGFRVSANDSTKCEQACDEKTCPASCIPNPDNDKRDTLQCYCPKGYILDVSGSALPVCADIDECANEMMCDHKCENLLGSYRCSCKEGFVGLDGGEKCVSVDRKKEEEEEEEDGSGRTPAYPPPLGARPSAVPSYVKAGSVLGIAVFLLLCAALLSLLVRNAVKRCGRLQLSSFKHPDIDIFYLQQVTTETYKRLSVDKQIKNEPQMQ